MSLLYRTGGHVALVLCYHLLPHQQKRCVMRKRVVLNIEPVWAALVAMLLLVVGFSAAASDHTGPLQQAAGAVLTDIEQTHWIAEGHGPHVVYIFFDPNCPYCHTLYSNSRSFVATGKIQLRWIPVGVLTTTSHGKALAMLGAKDPLQAFYQNENHYTRGNGGLDEDFGTPEVEQRLSANEAQWNRLGLGVVPIMLFYNKAGEPQLIQGAPPSSRLAALFSQVK